VSDTKKIAARAAALLDRADELRAEARLTLEPIAKARGRRGASDVLSSLMNFDLPRKADLPRIKERRRASLMRAAEEADQLGGPIAVEISAPKSRSR
jgi:hypothetical protein